MDDHSAHRGQGSGGQLDDSINHLDDTWRTGVNSMAGSGGQLDDSMNYLDDTWRTGVTKGLKGLADNWTTPPAVY